MTSYWQIFWLELKALWRSKTWPMLLVAAAVWMWVSPKLLTGDGTLAGARELYVHYSLGGVLALLVVSLLASATSSIATERTVKRLQLTMIRPVRHSLVVLSKAFALLLVGISVLTLSALVLCLKVGIAGTCSHVLSPVLESPRAEAEKMYAAYMENPSTPARVKAAKKSAVIRILTQKAVDRYQTITTNETAVWRFAGAERAEAPRLRMRFTNAFEMRQEVRGVFRFADAETAVSNLTQAVLTLPLNTQAPGGAELTFRNDGKSALMLRPRRDLNLLIRADAFGWNLLRTLVELTAILGLVIVIGLFLAAGLGRPVALFVAIAMLAIGEMSPSVVEQYPDELGANFADRLGLYITRFATEVTRPLSIGSPLEALAKDECVEREEVVRLVAVDLILLPLLLALAAGFVLPRKTE